MHTRRHQQTVFSQRVMAPTEKRQISADGTSETMALGTLESKKEEALCFVLHGVIIGTLENQAQDKDSKLFFK